MTFDPDPNCYARARAAGTVCVCDAACALYMLAMHRCKACGSPVPNPKERRLLESATSSSVRSGLVQFAGKVQDNAHPSINEHFCQGYVCRKCFTLVEKILVLRSKISELESTIASKLREGLVSFGYCGSQEHERGVKRSIHPSQQGACTPKRIHIENHPLTSDPVVISVHNPTRTQLYKLTPSRQPIANALGRKSHQSFAKHALKNDNIRRCIVVGLRKFLKGGIKSLCSDAYLLNKSKESLSSFSWDDLYNVVKANAPTVCAFLDACLASSSCLDSKVVVGVCVAILTKARRASASLLQCIISIVLYSGHSGKKVFTRLQKLGICLSSEGTMRVVDTLGKGHDEEVLKWVDSLKPFVSVTKGVITPSMKPHFSTEESSLSELQHSSSSDIFNTNTPSIPSTHPLPVRASTPVFSSPDVSYTSKDMSCSFLAPQEVSNITLGSVSSYSFETPTCSRIKGNVCNPDETVPDQLCPERDSHQILHQPYPLCDGYVHGIMCYGFKLVGDNLDKTVKPRDMRIDNVSLSLHYFNVFAVEDRVDFRFLSSDTTVINVDIDTSVFLPSSADMEAMITNFSVMVSRLLVKHIPALSDYSSCVPDHIDHKYSLEMSAKSNVVPLGVILKNENVLNEMVEILEELHKYVPMTQTEQEFDVVHDDNDVEHVSITVDHFHHILLGGDQLTVARVRGCQRIRNNSESGRACLEGLLPVAEDWHSKMCYLKVVWSRLYKTDSSQDGGTLYQLRNLINRRNVVTDPKKDMNSCEDFFELVTNAHVLTAAMEKFEMKSLTDAVSPNMFPTDRELTPEDRSAILDSAVREIISDFVDITFPEKCKKVPKDQDRVHEYAKETLTMGLIFLEFKDAVREGDGDRVMRCWKFLMLFFRASGHTKYTLEALNLLNHYHYLLPPRYAEQMKWNRFVNTQGKRGANISADLHMEHMNRICKEAINHLGANKTPKAVTRIGKVVGIVSSTLEHFDKVSGVDHGSGRHTRHSDQKDLNLVISELQKSKVFECSKGRKHDKFPQIQCNMFHSINRSKFSSWIDTNFTKLQLASNFNH